MLKILLCSHDPILARNLYWMLRDEGHQVETSDHPAGAVQMILGGNFDAAVLGSEPFGLSVDDAVLIVKTLCPGMPLLLLGRGHEGSAADERTPVDLADFRRLIRGIGAGTQAQAVSRGRA